MEEIYSVQKVKEINDYLFIETYKSNKIKTGVNEMMVNDEMSMTWNDEYRINQS